MRGGLVRVLVTLLTLTAAAVPRSLAACIVNALPTNGASSTSARAPNSNTLFQRAHYLILASEMSASGIANGTQIGGIGWTYVQGSGVSPMGTCKVYLQNTSDTTNQKS